MLHLRRVASVVAVLLVSLGLVVFDPNGPAAVANSGASLAGGNAWLVADFAMQAAEMGTTTNVNAQPVSMLGNDIRQAPTAALAPDAGRSKGFRLRPRGWAGALLTLGGAVGLDLLLAGDGAPDPVDTLPAPLSGEWAAYWNGGKNTWLHDMGQGDPGGTLLKVEVLSYPAFNQVGGGTVRLRATLSGSCWYAYNVPFEITMSVADGVRPNGVWKSSRTGVKASWNRSASPCGGVREVDLPVYDAFWGVGLSGFPVTGIGVGVTTPENQGVWWHPDSGRGVAGEASDPDTQVHTVVNRVECKGPDGVSEWFETAVEFTIGALREGLVVNIPEVKCPEDKYAASAEQEVRTETGGTVTTTPLSDGSLSDAAADRAAGIAAGTDTGLQLESEGVPCVVGEARCRGWTLDPDKDTRYQCKDNGVTVHLSRCLIYEDAFKPEGGKLGDPLGESAGTPTDEEGYRCWPEGWGRINPAEWVYRPVRCALEWAFVPTRSETSIGRIRTAVDATAPVVWSRAVGGIFDQVPAAAGCEGPRLHFDAFGLVVDAHPFSACQAPMSTAAMWTRNITTVLVVVFGSMACVRALGSGLGWKPSAGGDS